MRNWLSGHLSVLILIPVVLLILVGVIGIYSANSSLSDASYTVRASELLNKTSSLVHEMQKERGMSAGFIASNGANFGSAIPAQRLAVDTRIKELSDYLEDNTYDSETQQNLDNLQQRLRQLTSIRQRVSNQTIAIGDMLSYYTENNRIMLELPTILSDQIDSRISSQQFETLYNLASIKENAGIERAVLNSVFGGNQLTDELNQRFITLVTRQETYFHNAELLANDEFKVSLQQFKNSTEEARVIDFRQAARIPSRVEATDAEDWFAASTARIDLLKTDENLLLQQIIDTANDSYSSDQLIIIIELLVVALTIYLTYVILHTLARRNEQTTEIDRVTTLIVRERDLTSTATISDPGDLGNIAKDINDTMQKLRDDFNAFKSAATEVVDASQNTSVIVEETSRNLFSMRENISNLMQAFNSLNTDIISDIAKISEAEDMSSQVAEGAKEGAKSVSSAVSQINDMAKEVDSVGAVIKLLNERVNDILGMVDVIRSVAEQTNLLALNAAIEAARAGEQGRGFAVVADEVRSLASRTQESTEEIARVVDELMNSAQNAITAIDVGSEKANDAVASVNNIDDVLSKVVSNISELDNLTSDIASSAQKQIQQITQLSANVLQIDHMADENAKGGEEVAAATVQVFNLSAEMMTKIESYKTANDTNASPSATTTTRQASATKADIEDDDSIELF